MGKIDLCQVNVCGLSERSRICLENYLYENKADIACLSEVKNETTLEIKNFHHFFKASDCNPAQKGGVSVLVSKIYSGDRQTFLEKPSIDAIFVVVNLKGKRYLLCSVYIPPQSPGQLKQFLQLVVSAKLETTNLKCECLLIMGDFNARHPNWGDTKENSHGKILNEFIGDTEFDLWSKYDGNSFQCSGGGSRIDLVMTNLNATYEQKLDNETELFTGAPLRGHVPVWTSLLVSETQQNSGTWSVFDWENTDWFYFEDTVNYLTFQALPNLANADDPFLLWNRAKDILLKAKSTAVPTKLITQHSKPYWNSELSCLSKTLREARKNFKFRSNFTNGEVLREAKEKFTSALDNAKNAYLEKQAAELNNSEGQEMWKKLKSCLNKSQTNGPNHIGTLVCGGEKVVDDFKKTSIFRDEIFRGKHLANCNFDNSWKDYVEKTVNSSGFYESNSTEVYNQKILTEEIVIAMKKLNLSKKSVDVDGIHPMMLRHSGNQFQVLLLKLYNAVMQSQAWPWSEGKVILLKKPGKSNYSDPGSYRPITITSYVGKLMESILKNRLTSFLEREEILSPSQHGFRKNFSTASYMFELTTELEKSVKSKKSTAGVFVDLQKAFDSVWIVGLMFKLRNIGISGPFLKLISSYLLSRTVKIHLNGITSEYFDCQIGVPQGGVLSPTLFAVYINDMLDFSSQIGKSLQYADDTSIVLNADNDVSLSEKCQSCCDSISNWLEKWRLKANCSKTDLIVFKGSCIVPNISGEKINKSSQTKVLGIVIDERLTFDQQLRNCQNSLVQKWNMVKPFIYRGLNVETGRFILLHAIMSSTHYLSFIWDFKHRLSVYQMVKDLSRAPLNPPAEHLYVMTDVKPLEIRYSQLRLSLLRTLPESGWEILSQKTRGVISNKFLTDCQSYVGSRNIDFNVDICLSKFTKTQIKKYIFDKWGKHYLNFCRANPSSGLLSDIKLCQSIYSGNKLPLNVKSRVFGSLCGLLTGHCRLQYHLYVLDLTFTPTCICLTGDETSQHYLFDCPLYSDLRPDNQPAVLNWYDVANYITKSGRTP